MSNQVTNDDTDQKVPDGINYPNDPRALIPHYNIIRYVKFTHKSPQRSMEFRLILTSSSRNNLETNNINYIAFKRGVTSLVNRIQLKYQYKCEIN